MIYKQLVVYTATCRGALKFNNLICITETAIGRDYVTGGVCGEGEGRGFLICARFAHLGLCIFHYERSAQLQLPSEFTIYEGIRVISF